MPKQKIQTLEVLRGLAALAVVVTHTIFDAAHYKIIAETASLEWLGVKGVELFFVLSGFVIYYVHAKDIGQPDRAANYLWRRWLRIWPLYAVLTMMDGVVRPLWDQAVVPLGLVVASLLFLNVGGHPIISVGWTLVHEAFFYACFLLAIVGGRQFARIFYGFGFLGVFLALSSESGGVLYNWIFSSQKLFFLSGIAAAAWTLKRGGSDEKYHNTIVWIFVAALLIYTLAALLLVGEDSLRLIRPFWTAAGMAVFMALMVLIEGRWAVKAPRIFLYLGAASYSVYLAHSFALVTSMQVYNRFGLSEWAFLPVSAFLVIAGVGAVIVGVLCHELLEKPLTRLIRKFGK